MNEEQKNDLYYMCSLIEFIARKTKNYPGDVVKKIGKTNLKKLFYLAEVNHCLSFEQVSDEIIENYNVLDGDFDIVANCKYVIPRFLEIGKLYQRLIIDTFEIDNNEIEAFYNVFISFLSYKICNYNSALYYSGRSYLKTCYLEGKIVA